MVTTLKHLFTPQSTNNHRPRILHPAGLTVVIGIFLLYHTWVKLLMASPLPQGLVLGYASAINASQVIEGSNVERAKVGLPPLKHNPVLSQAAAAKANDMFQDNYWAHIAPDGTTPWSFIKGAGYQYQVAGENLARDFADTPAMITAWMDSPSHKDNIINQKYIEIGVAVVDGTLEGIETTLVVQMFGVPAVSLAQTGEAGMSTQTQLAVPAPTRLPTPGPTKSPEIMGLEGLTITNQRDNLNGAVWISPLTLTKSVAIAVILMLVSILIYDEYLINKHKITRRVGKNWAHLTIFGIVLMLIVVVSEGKISNLAAQDGAGAVVNVGGTDDQ